MGCYTAAVTFRRPQEAFLFPLPTKVWHSCAAVFSQSVICIEPERSAQRLYGERGSRLGGWQRLQESHTRCSWPTARILRWVFKHFRSSAYVRRKFCCPTRPCIHAEHIRKHRFARVPRAYDHQNIYGQNIITFVFQEHMLIQASMPKP